MTHSIMVIDDEPDLLSMVRDYLVNSGYDVLTAAHPDAVLDASKDVHPDLFLIDIVLPAMTGIELAAALRERGYDHTPIIGMSASRLMRQLAGLSGLFSTIIVKPFELANLRSLIRCYLGDTVTPHAVR